MYSWLVFLAFGWCYVFVIDFCFGWFGFTSFCVWFSVGVYLILWFILRVVLFLVNSLYSLLVLFCLVFFCLLVCFFLAVVFCYLSCFLVWCFFFSVW